MNIANSITELYCRIDDALLPYATPHPQAIRSISAVVAIGVRYLCRQERELPPLLPRAQGQRWRYVPQTARTPPPLPSAGNLGLLDRLLPGSTHHLGVADSYGVELGHPVRAGRNFHPVGKKGKSNHRWIVGANSAWWSTSGG